MILVIAVATVVNVATGGGFSISGKVGRGMSLTWAFLEVAIGSICLWGAMRGAGTSDRQWAAAQQQREADALFAPA
jgi:hypothetical protein